jgi:hypothetical protein
MLVTMGCGSTPAPPSTGDLPCDVDKVLASSCRSCHGATPAYGAPMSLVTYADLTAAAVTDPNKRVYELVEARVHDDAHPMPQPPNARLSDGDLAAIDAWVQAGAPKGSASCEGAGGAGGGGGAPPVTIDCTPDIHLAPSAAWQMPQDKADDYVCYGIDVPAGDRKNVIGFVPRIDNTKIVHHVLLYQSETSVSPVPTECSGSVTVTGKKLIYAWAPGGSAFKMPDEAGFPMDATTHYYVQVHYNNIQGLAGETDSSGFDLCSTPDTRPNAADVVAFGTVDITLPPAQSTVRDCSYKWPAIAGQVHAIAAFPHMHKLGTSISTVQNPAGAAVDLGTNEPWSFNNQPFIPISATINPGDTIETRCQWENTTPSTVSFGEYTEDEMCFSFTMYYPAAPSFKSWLVPSVKSTCQ